VKRPLFALVALSLTAAALACGRANGDPSGSSDSQALLALLPRDATGVFFVDVQKAMAVPASRDAVAENREKLDEFIAETGIDPTRDLFCVAGAVSGKDPQDKEADGVMIVKAKVDKKTLLDRIREKEGKVTEDTYQGVTVYGMPSGLEGKSTQLAFLDGDVVAMGTPLEVRTVIDIQQKRAENMLGNAELMDVVKATNRNGILWAAFVLDRDDMQELTESNPMLGQLNGLQSMMMSVDYKDATFLADVLCRSASPEQNQQMVDFLNGMKSFAAMGAAENPDAAEMLRKIEITSGPDNIHITAAIPEALLEKMKNEPGK
jgi:hypothetical protein